MRLFAGFSRRECTSAGGRRTGLILKMPVQACATVTVVGPDCQSVTGDRLTGLILKMLVKVLNLQLRSIVVFSYCYGERMTWLQVYKNI